MISGYLIGDKDLIARLTSLPEKIKPALDATVQRMAYQVKATSQRDWLRGPRPGRLGVRTGRLLSSIATRFEFTPTSSIAYVGTNVNYGIAWEKGFHGLVPVKPYLRHTFKYKMATADLTKYNIGAGLVTYRKKTNQVIGYAWVNGFFRNINMNPRPFLSTALAQNKQLIIDEIAKALNNAVAQALKR